MRPNCRPVEPSCLGIASWVEFSAGWGSRSPEHLPSRPARRTRSVGGVDRRHRVVHERNERGHVDANGDSHAEHPGPPSAGETASPGSGKASYASCKASRPRPAGAEERPTGPRTTASQPCPPSTSTGCPDRDPSKHTPQPNQGDQAGPKAARPAHSGLRLVQTGLYLAAGSLVSLTFVQGISDCRSTKRTERKNPSGLATGMSDLQHR